MRHLNKKLGAVEAGELGSSPPNFADLQKGEKAEMDNLLAVVPPDFWKFRHLC